MKTELFLKRIRREFPEIKWKRYRCLAQGWDHSVVMLDEKIVFRAPKPEGKEYKQYISRFKNEIRLLRYLKKKVNVGIPEYEYVSKDKSFAGYNLLEGKELTLQVFCKLSASEKMIAAKRLADFITVIHEVPKSVIKKYCVKKENQRKLFDDFARDTKKLLFPRLRKKDVRLIEEHIRQLDVALNQKYPSVLIHNDLTSEHILWDSKNRQINIIDFGDRAFGDPASDFAGLMEYGCDFAKNVFDLYKGKKDGQMLHRSQLFFKNIPLYIMKDALEGYPCTFRKGYRLFKKRFDAKFQ